MVFEFVSDSLCKIGRLSDVFSLQSGAVVEPLDPETQLREHSFISHAVVVGRDQNFAVAFLTLDRNVMEPVAKVDCVVDVCAFVPFRCFTFMYMCLFVLFVKVPLMLL